MYLLVTYDVVDNRTEKFRKILTRYLTHEQNSVFSGDLKESEFIQLKKELSTAQVPADSIMIVTAENRNNVNVTFLTKDEGNNQLIEIEHNHHKRSSIVV